MSISLSPSQLAEFLAAAIPARHPVLIVGAPGVGKSDSVAQAAATAQADLIVSHPVTADPTDAKGLPWKKDGEDAATFLPYGEMKRAIYAQKPTVWLLDDLGQASPAVQASFMQLILARRVNGHVLPDCVTFVAATNRRADRAGVSGILEPVKSRFTSIVELVPTIDDWVQWAYANNVSPALIAFLRTKPDLLCDFKPSADLTNSPVPRTWHNLARIEALKLPAKIEQATMAGAVGEGASIEYLAFRKLVEQIPNLDAILLNPDKAKIPSSPDQLHAVCVGLAARANAQNFARIAVYVDRLNHAKRGEFAALLVKDAARREPAIAYTDAFQKLLTGPFGQIVSGQV